MLHGSDGMQLLTRSDLAPWVQALKERCLNVLAPDLRDSAWMCPAAVEDLADLIRNGKNNMAEIVYC